MRRRPTDKQAKEALFRLGAIVESSEDAIIGKTLEGIITSWDPGAEALYGYHAKEVLGKSISLLIPPDRSNELPAIIDRLKAGGRIQQYETVRLRKDGRQVYVSVSMSPVRDDSGRIVGVATIARDITGWKQMEAERERLLEQVREVNGRLVAETIHSRELAEEVQSRSAELDAAISSSADGLLIYDPMGEIVLMNRAAERMPGISEMEPKPPLAH